jgi:hypothetical protein
MVWQKTFTVQVERLTDNKQMQTRVQITEGYSTEADIQKILDIAYGTPVRIMHKELLSSTLVPSIR